MNKSAFIGAILGAIAVTAGTTIAGISYFNSNHDSTAATALPSDVAKSAPAPIRKAPSFAEVIKVTPRTSTVQTPRQVCHDEVITHTTPPKDKYRIIGTATGAALGGLLGNQFGGGTANKAITAAGVVAGGYAGNKTQEKIQEGKTYTTTEQRCETVSDARQEPNGFDVTYRLNGKTSTAHMNRDPGQRIPVRNGHIVL